MWLSLVERSVRDREAAGSNPVIPTERKADKRMLICLLSTTEVQEKGKNCMEKKKDAAVKDLTRGVIWKQLVMFALPFLASSLLQQFYSTADAAIVGHSVGAAALAAIGSCDKLTLLMINLFVGISTGVSIAASQAFGKKNAGVLSRTIHSAAAMGFAAGIFLTVIGILLAPKFLVLMNTPENVLPMAVSYIQIYFLGMTATMLYNMGNGILRALGNSKSALYYLSVSGLINVVLDLIFVRGFSWGVKGAAAATVIAQSLPAVLVLLKLTKLDEAYRLKIKKIGFYRQELLYIMKVGVPAGIRIVLVNFSNIVVQSRINAFGLEAMAGATLFYKLDGYLYTTISAVSLALTSFAGQNIGAADYRRVIQGKKTAMVMTTCTTLTLVAVMWFFTEPICRIFTSDGEAVAYGCLQLHYLLPLYVIFAWNEIINGTVLSSGHTVIPMLVNLLGMCGARLAFIFIGSYFVYDIRTIYLAFPFSWIVTHLFISLYYYRGKWMEGMCFSEAVKQQERADKR